ncbi:MAG: hypothetical protein AAF787_24865, partial [Chloroflexota bacterium]
RTYSGHSRAVYDISVHPDGDLLLSAGWDGTVRLWDVETGEELALWQEHPAPVRAVAFHPDGNGFASADMRGNLYIWQQS